VPVNEEFQLRLKPRGSLTIMVCRNVAVIVYWFLASTSHSADATWSTSHLRAGIHIHRAREKQLPPAGVASAPVSAIMDLFTKLDANGDGKIDVNELAMARHYGILPVSSPAPAPAPGSSPGGVPAFAPGPSPVPAEDSLPPHLLHPPPLPSDIPEPPPPPPPPPKEPQPPPLPPREGQLVNAPPSEENMKSSGMVNTLMSGVPGLDLAGNDPVLAPNTPPPIPVPLPPPELPKAFAPLAPPSTLDKSIMGPSPVGFGTDIARTLPAGVSNNTAPTGIVPMPEVPAVPPPQSSQNGNWELIAEPRV